MFSTITNKTILKMFSKSRYQNYYKKQYILKYKLQLTLSVLSCSSYITYEYMNKNKYDKYHNNLIYMNTYCDSNNSNNSNNHTMNNNISINIDTIDDIYQTIIKQCNSNNSNNSSNNKNIDIYGFEINNNTNYNTITICTHIY